MNVEREEEQFVNELETGIDEAGPTSSNTTTPESSSTSNGATSALTDRDEAEKQKLKRLHFLLDKTKLFSKFLGDRIVPNSDNAQPDAKPAQPNAPTSKKRKHEEVDAPKPSSNNRTQPSLISGGPMKDYQIEGLNWLVNLFENGVNGILADEMGLGKTIQCLSLFSWLMEKKVFGPFLVVAPLSTINNWINEGKKWCPKIPMLMYHGSKEDRKQIRDAEFKKGGMLPVVVTSYEIVLRDRKYLEKFEWKYLVVDEGHRLKNLNCKLIRELKKISSANRLLLTGTPLQNNLSELWSLLNFLLPDIFDDLESFESWFDFDEVGDSESMQKIIAKEEQNQLVSKLHDIMRPFLLRRLKSQVEMHLPKKYEKVVRTKLSDIQQTYYKAILTKTLTDHLTPQAWQQMKNKGASIQNTAIQLRKCCNHPYLFEWKTDSHGEDVLDESLVSNSGKMMVLDAILKRLHQEGHKVLIFSQMTRMLDILEAYMELRKYEYCRIDGSTPEQTRQEQISTFHQDPNIFCFLLSTRAGGLGINLTAASNVIFYDSDWNPQMDLQAQDRAHRIGQTKDVHIWRLVTSDSIEAKMLERANAKLKLERLAIHKGNFLGVASKSSITSVYDLHELLQSEDVGKVGHDQDDEESLFSNWNATSATSTTSTTTTTTSSTSQ
jgi:ATP-dependent DNA helicase